MELRRYWDVIRRHLPLVLAVPLVVGLSALGLALLRPLTYTATSKVNLTLVSQQAAAPDQNFFRYDNYYTYLATEFAADDLVEMINGGVFAAAVARTAHDAPYSLPLDEEQAHGVLAARRVHRGLWIEVHTQRREWAAPLAQAAMETLQRDLAATPAAGAPQVQARLIENPHRVTSDRGQRLFNVALQTLLGLGFVVGLAFLREYLADRPPVAATVGGAAGVAPALGRR